jgi:hypothetical protein
MTGRRRRALVAAVVVALALAAVVAGCGESTLTGRQLRAGATQACRLAQRSTARIATPTMPAGGTAFLTQGITVMTPELVALHRLRAPGNLSGDYRAAMQTVADELARLNSTVRALRAGNDPVAAIETLQQQLAPIEARAADVWHALGLAVCQSP